MKLLNRIFHLDKANGHEFVDLGLSVYWATMNIGARAAYEYGSRFMWGSTNAHAKKDKFSMEISFPKYRKYCTGSTEGIVDYRTTLLPADDAAHKKMGGQWRMPTVDEIEELIQKCSWQLVCINHVIDCYMITGKNGNHIVLPLSCLWSSSLYENNAYGYYLWFYGDKRPGIYHSYRYCCHAVRGVLPK